LICRNVQGGASRRVLKSSNVSMQGNTKKFSRSRSLAIAHACLGKWPKKGWIHCCIKYWLGELGEMVVVVRWDKFLFP
jgi:hypothetical protein